VHGEGCITPKTDEVWNGNSERHQRLLPDVHDSDLPFDDAQTEPPTSTLVAAVVAIVLVVRAQSYGHAITRRYDVCS